MEIIHEYLPRVSMQFLQGHWVLCPPDTDLHKHTSVHLWAWVAHQRSSWLHNASWLHALHNSLKFDMCCVLDNTWTPYFQSATFSLPHWYMVRGHLHVISDLHHYWLTSLQTCVIVKSQHTLTTTHTHTHTHTHTLKCQIRYKEKTPHQNQHMVKLIQP